jgi:acyl dehydratase
MRYFEDFHVGHSEAFPGSYLVTQEEIVEMGERWDPQPFHTDPAAAEQTLFGGLVASTVHLFGIMSALGMKRPDQVQVAAVSALGVDNMRLHAPARPGDELAVTSTVIEARVSTSRPEVGILKQRNQLFNQRDELVFSNEVAWLIARRP